MKIIETSKILTQCSKCKTWSVGLMFSPDFLDLCVWHDSGSTQLVRFDQSGASKIFVLCCGLGHWVYFSLSCSSRL